MGPLHAPARALRREFAKPWSRGGRLGGTGRTGPHTPRVTGVGRRGNPLGPLHRKAGPGRAEPGTCRSYDAPALPARPVVRLPEGRPAGGRER